VKAYGFRVGDKCFWIQQSRWERFWRGLLRKPRKPRKMLTIQWDAKGVFVIDLDD
jgi:hypothetical protein